MLVLNLFTRPQIADWPGYEGSHTAGQHSQARGRPPLHLRRSLLCPNNQPDQPGKWQRNIWQASSMRLGSQRIPKLDESEWYWKKWNGYISITNQQYFLFSRFSIFKDFWQRPGYSFDDAIEGPWKSQVKMEWTKSCLAGWHPLCICCICRFLLEMECFIFFH